MIESLVILGLGLYALYALRDGLLILQNKREAKENNNELIRN